MPQTQKLRQVDLETDLAGFTERQLEAMHIGDSGYCKFLLYGGALGGGKALALDTPLPTPAGWTTMGEVKVGDQVIDKDGNPCNVVVLSPIIHEDTYRITFSDGAEIIAGANHEWVTRTMQERQRLLRGGYAWRVRRRAKRASKASGLKSSKFTEAITKRNQDNPPPIQDIPVKGIRTTREIYETLSYGSGKNHSIDIAKSFKLPDRDLLVDPYVLGAWLGDGVSVSGIISGIDEGVFLNIANSGYKVTQHANPTNHGVWGLKAELSALGVLGNKHIPAVYLRGSKEQRLALLQGLMDTDGCCYPNGHCEISLTNHQLAKDVHELILSLGIKCTLKRGIAKLNGAFVSFKYRMKFLHDKPVFRLSRKLINQKFDAFRGTHARRYISKVEPVSSVPLRCIQVDSRSHTYLCGREMIPTHNSYFLRWYGVRRLMLLASWGYEKPVGMLACEDYPTLKDRQLNKIAREVPTELGTLYQDHKDYGRCLILAPRHGGGVLCFRNLDDPSKYQSSEWAFILVDELTKNAYDVFTDLRMRLRWPGLPDEECQFVAGTNPGGPGHGWVKQFWMDKTFPAEWIDPIDYRPLFAYVPSKADDNPHLDAAYWSMLSTLPENLRESFRDGRWDVFVGQAFPQINKEVHAIQPVWPIPDHAPIYTTFDWGFGAPFSWGWWWMDEEGRAIRCNRWYGASGPNQGLRLSDSEVAEGIIDREIKMGLAAMACPGDYKSVKWNRQIIRYAGFDCFAKRPDYKGGGQGPTTAEVFGAYGIHIAPMDSARHVKIRQFRERLRVREDGWPMLLVYDTDEEFFRIMPTLVMDKLDIEDVDSSGPDHIYDEACHIAMGRPLGLEQPYEKPRGPAAIIAQVEQGLDYTEPGSPDRAIVAPFGDDGFGEEVW